MYWTASTGYRHTPTGMHILCIIQLYCNYSAIYRTASWLWLKLKFQKNKNLEKAKEKKEKEKPSTCSSLLSVLSTSPQVRLGIWFICIFYHVDVILRPTFVPYPPDNNSVSSIPALVLFWIIIILLMQDQHCNRPFMMLWCHSFAGWGKRDRMPFLLWN